MFAVSSDNLIIAKICPVEWGEMTFSPQFFSTCSSYFSHHGEQVPERDAAKGK